MTEPNESNPEDTEIHLSVQGNYFIVQKSLIEAHNWILSKIISSDIPWRKTSDKGQIFLDIDPVSFRIILAILNGTFSIHLPKDIDSLSFGDLALLKATARYLMLDEVYEALDLKEGEIGMMREELCTTKEKLAEAKERASICSSDLEEARRTFKRKEHQVRKKEHELDALLETFDVQSITNLEKKAELLDRIQTQLKRLKIKISECHTARCGFSTSMIIGNLRPEHRSLCRKCKNVKRWPWRMKRNKIKYIQSDWNMKDVEGFTDQLECLQCCRTHLLYN